MQYFLTILFVSFSLFSFSQKDKEVDDQVHVINCYDNSRLPDSLKIFIAVETMPVFPRCKQAKSPNDCTQRKIREFIEKNVVYDPKLENAGVQGKVWVSFVVNKEGKVEQVKVVKGVHKKLDKEAKKVVESLPTFTPGTQQGKVVSVRYVVPVIFKTSNKE